MLDPLRVLYPPPLICSDLYDTEKARMGDYPSQTRPELAILGHAEPPGIRENDYGPIPPSAG